MKSLYKKHGKWIRAIAFIVVFCLINGFLDMALIQSGVTRIIVNDMNKTEEDYQCVVLGQSHATYGIDPEIITDETGMNTTNASIGGEYMLDMYYMAKEMYSNHLPKVVLIDIDYLYFLNVPSTENTIMSTVVYYNYPTSYRKIMYSHDKLMKKEYRTALFHWLNYRDAYDVARDTLWNKRTKAYRDYDPAAVTQIESCDTYKGNGFIYRDKTFKRDENAKCTVNWDGNIIDTGKSLDYFEKMVNLCKEKGSKVIMVTTPINVETLLADESLPQYDMVQDYFNELARNNKVDYYDFNLVKPSKFIRDTNDYWDYDGHMYGEAAERYSKFLGGFLKNIDEEDNIDLSEYLYEDIYDMKKNYEHDVVSVIKNGDKHGNRKQY